VRSIGTLRAIDDVVVRPETSGRIEEIGFQEGRTVEAGQVLFRLDDDKLQRELARQQANLASAKADVALSTLQYERANTLYQENVGTEEEADRTRTQLERDRAEVNRLEAEIALVEERLEDTVIRAAFTGLIGQSAVDVGDYVQTGESLTSLFAVQPLELSVTLPERFAGRVRRGMGVSVMVTAYPERRFNGEVTYVSPDVSERSRDFIVKATLPNDDGVLKPGMFATAEIVIDIRDKRPVIPEEALVSTRTGYRVFVVENGKAVQREVEIGLRRPGEVEIRAGVEAGETVVRSGAMNIQDGAPVRVLEGPGAEPNTSTEDDSGGAAA